MKGSVDLITAEGSVGWLFAEPHGRKPLVQAFLHHRLVGQAVADLYRPDLEQVGLGDGRHGFDIRFDENVDRMYLPFLSVRPEGFDLTIPANLQAGLLDLIGTVMAEYPTTGRSRSVLGGLWTDRLDASSVLAGRMAVGSVSAGVQPSLSSLIAHGHATLSDLMDNHWLGEREIDLVDTVNRVSRNGELPSSDVRAALSGLADFLFRDLLVQVLRSVFDDHPVAYQIDVLRDAQTGLAQACSLDALPSPAECALLYLGGGEDARVEIVRDSHELPEFTQTGRSRWSPQGASAVRGLIDAQAGSIEVVELEPRHMLLVGPGTIHRVVATPTAPVLRVLLAPRRVTPKRFLTGEGSWLEAAHVSGGRLRL